MATEFLAQESIPDFERTSVVYEHLLHEQLEKVFFL
jgi:hypothetical protein